ncbi:MAG: matrixin family metalloprotease [Bacteroidia bacterium]
MMRPITLEQRATEASHIVLGRLLSKESYWDYQHHNIYTLNIIEVGAWLKGHQSQSKIGVISLGGFVEDRGQISHPSVDVAPYNEYVFFLNADNQVLDNKAMRIQFPDMIQAETFASSQGAITKQSGIYHDLLSESPQDEASLFHKIEVFTHQQALTPTGEKFTPRLGDTYPLYEWATGNERLMPITSFTPTPTNSGTIVTTDFVTITGSGFGAVAGTVFYTNADDGGATFTSSGIASDNVAWSATSITNKVARAAGTGPINVNGAMTSGSNLTINYAHLNINSTFQGFGSSTRQRYYLLNKNGTGGYTFVYNTAFNSNSAAVAAFERALNTWRCATFVNFQRSGTTAISTAVLDGVNVVTFDGSLPVGVLGLCTTRFNGSATGGCNLANTVWWADELDVQFFPDPPTAGFPWEYGPAAPSFSEYDFESVAVHELGHGHGLGHVIAAGTVMHFGLANGQSARNLGANEINGGLNKMGYSTAAICFTPATTFGPMTAVVPGSCILPVNFLHFDGAYLTGRGNRLEWATSWESDNSGFAVEWGLDGTNFREIGWVASRGDHEVESSYAFMDAQPVAGTTNYYRLRQVDINGGVSYSETVAILVPDQSNIVVIPTLVKDELRVTGQLEGGLGKFSLTDMRGVTVRSQVLSGGFIDSRINTADLAAGIYVYRILGTKGEVLSGKVVKD